ncbi:MAG TPA: translation initiation factor IF-3, partial [Candidatus Saccharimonadia bacterium]|nr:translation initiation factor IF-3 [Candidatus Saccharimonadia bacterium]
LGGAISKSFFKINQFIQASELRVLDQFNKQLGVMTKSEALQKANELGVDLVEIAPSAKPPVAKLIDFAKFKYQIAQKAQEDKRKTKISEIKELRMTPVIAQGDFDARMKKARKFLEGGDKVRLNVKFAGRMITKKEYGEKVLKRAVDQLSDISMVEIPAKLIGKFMMMQLSPVKKKKPSDLQPKQPQPAQAPKAPKTEPKAKVETKKE